MNVRTSLEADMVASEVMQPDMGALNDPANLSETTAARLHAPVDTRGNAAFVQDALHLS